ncbi:chromosome segregation protein SMC [Magnetovibrio sp.]|uniref:chromosome segregation protein SMC n=1 Tax=Magnetovibrio sp. TaxID=2024836 RepID=UPI002F93F7BA
MLRFTKLRLSGFKSFVDPTELKIEPGLTGVVGPNGCGKSNLVEALKWVMGETSAKQMRGASMDDVIFGGSSNRPARNVAEVVLHLDNKARIAPAMFNDAEDLEVVRKIERESGSNYKVNGKDVRAKDVQLLFADAASGSRSTALVSQGKIGQVISAKPADRRVLLEEAAGITGLHSRRHEAELRLRGAENNLSRLDDILITLEGQLQSLKKQARQATRYRNLSDHIRKAEALLFHIRWINAIDGLEVDREKLKEAEAIVAQLTAQVAAAATAQAGAADVVPGLRQVETEAAAELQRLSLARDGLDDEVKRIEDARLDRVHRLEQVSHDIARERNLAEDATQASERLLHEKNDIVAAQDGEGDAVEEAAEALSEATALVNELEENHTQLTDKLAADEAQRASLTRSVQDLETRIDQLSHRLRELNDQRKHLERVASETSGLNAAEAALAAAEDAITGAREHLETAEATSAATQETSENVRQHLQEVRVALSRLEAEEQALAKVLETGEPEMWPPMIEAVSVEVGFEAALGAALGEELDASSDESAPVHWTALDPYPDAPALPAGARALSDVTQAPHALKRRLSQIGVVDDVATGERLSRELKQGQRLVSREGALWRWDGYTITEGAQTAAAVRLEQLNRLKDVRAQLETAEAQVDEADAKALSAREAAEDARDAERAARQALREREAAHSQARDQVAQIRTQIAEQNSKLEAVVNAAETLERDISEAKEQCVESQVALGELPNTELARENVMRVREELADKRTIQVERQGIFAGLKRNAEERARRLADIERELASWSERSEGAVQRIADLEERTGQIRAELEELAQRPEEIKQKRLQLLDFIDAAEAKRQAAADQLAEAERRLAESDKGLREAESGLALARETRVRIEGSVEQGKQACASIAERVKEKLDCGPDNLAEVAELEADAALPDEESVERKVERLMRERDTMGPVNLRAEDESREMEEQIDTLKNERGDLIEAIEKLRRGINELNREGRERLLASFREVDKHFQELFVRLFGGGQAHLKLIEADDPLESGLEILASPPGKRMQVLSLLSGGEQALTATALLFAVFMTNPAPICVLDEVDAPLDDANVDRFCTMLEEMAASGSTRFMIITHHRMTMARMDRLFGVTMSERGVSQLVSVDLEQAEKFRESA